MLMFARGDLEEGYQHPFQVSRAGRMRMRTKPHKSSLVVGDIYAMPEGAVSPRRRADVRWSCCGFAFWTPSEIIIADVTAVSLTPLTNGTQGRRSLRVARSISPLR